MVLDLKSKLSKMSKVLENLISASLEGSLSNQLSTLLDELGQGPILLLQMALLFKVGELEGATINLSFLRMNSHNLGTHLVNHSHLPLPEKISRLKSFITMSSNLYSISILKGYKPHHNLIFREILKNINLTIEELYKL